MLFFLFTLHLLRFIIIILIVLSQTSVAQNDLGETFSINFVGNIIDFFKELEKERNIKFAFKHQDLEDISGKWNFKQKTVYQILDKICSNYLLKYEPLTDGQIVIKKLNYPIKIKGFIRNAKNGERVISALILSEDGNATHSDENGFFNIQISTDIRFSVVAEGFQIFHYEQIQNSNNLIPTLYIYLAPISSLSEIVIKPKLSSLKMLQGKGEIIPKTGQKMPIAGGETDVMQGMRLLGGIKPALGSAQGWSIRGNRPDDNLILIDGMPVYHTSHLLGVISIFNAHNINQIQVFKDEKSTKYGGRTGGIVSVNLDDGNKNRWTGMMDAGIISSGISLSGPLIKEKLSISFAARRSYFDLLTDPAQRVISQNQFVNYATNLRFYSIYGKLHYKLNEKNDFRLSVHNSGDLISYGSEIKLQDTFNSRELNQARLSWNNLLINSNWDHRFSDKVDMKIQSGYSQTDYSYVDLYRMRNDNGQDENRSDRKSGLSDFRNSIHINWYGKTHRFSMTTGLNFLNLTPNDYRYFKENDLFLIDTILASQSQLLQERFVGVEDFINLKQLGRMTVGIRLVQYDVSEGEKVTLLEPRFSWSRPLDSLRVFRINYTRMTQALNALPSANLGIPHPLWFSLYAGIKPLISDQMSVNFISQMKKGSWNINAFYRIDNNIYHTLPGKNSAYALQDPQNSFLNGSGISYGLEFQLRLFFDKWSILPVYSYVRSTEVYLFLNNGNRFYSGFDGPHLFNLLFNYAPSKKYSLSFNFHYYSGSPITLPQYRYVTTLNGTPVVLDEYRSINNFRMVPSHQMDVQYQRIIEKDKLKHHFTLGLFNMYSQINPFMVFVGLNESGEQALKIRSFLPFLPILKYALEF